MALNPYFLNGSRGEQRLIQSLVNEHLKETGSNLSKKLIENFDDEINNFIQVCPKEMLDKLKNPITLKKQVKKVS